MGKAIHSSAPEPCKPLTLCGCGILIRAAKPRDGSPLVVANGAQSGAAWWSFGEQGNHFSLAPKYHVALVDSRHYLIGRLQLLQDVRDIDLVVHGHRSHPAFNFLAIYLQPLAASFTASTLPVNVIGFLAAGS